MRATFAFSALAVAALGSAVMMWSGVKDGSFAATAWSAASFVVVAVLIGLQLNRPYWSNTDGGGATTDRQLSAMRGNAQLCAAVYAWGALVLAVMYKLTGLYWQHGLQYACGMLLLGAVIFGWTRLAQPGGWFATPEGAKQAALLNMLHGATAAIATAIFLASGKFWVPRPDWAANIVFLAGGFSIVSLCIIAAITHARIARQG